MTYAQSINRFTNKMGVTITHVCRAHLSLSLSLYPDVIMIDPAPEDNTSPVAGAKDAPPGGCVGIGESGKCAPGVLKCDEPAINVGTDVALGAGAGAASVGAQMEGWAAAAATAATAAAAGQVDDDNSLSSEGGGKAKAMILANEEIVGGTTIVTDEESVSYKDFNPALQRYKGVRSVEDVDNHGKTEESRKFLDAQLAWKDKFVMGAEYDDKVDVIGEATRGIGTTTIFCIVVVAINGSYKLTLGDRAQEVVAPGEAYRIMCNGGMLLSGRSCVSPGCLFHTKKYRPVICAQGDGAEVHLACWQSSKNEREKMTVRTSTEIKNRYPFRLVGMPEDSQMWRPRDNPCNGDCLAYTIVQHCIFLGIKGHGDGGPWGTCYDEVRQSVTGRGLPLTLESMNNEVVQSVILEYVQNVFINRLLQFIMDDMQQGESIMRGVVAWYSKGDGKMTAEEYLESEMKCLLSPVDAEHYPKFSIVGRAASMMCGFNITAWNPTLAVIERTDRWDGDITIAGYPPKLDCPPCFIYHHVGGKPFKIEGKYNHWLYLEHGSPGIDCAYDGTARSLKRMMDELQARAS